MSNSALKATGAETALQENTDEVVISVRNVKKMFRVYRDRGNTLKDRILFAGRRKYEEHWVLNGVSFEVKRGEAIGLIGQNGCGKSTTLKMLTKILYPDEGTIEMKGRVSSLIELGAGFHPDLSGRENIYTNASIFGLSRKEIDERLEDIIAFSELEAFIDDPVRTYSSGMYMRLAFAVAINVDADILLIDEILAVGDAAFQAKCFRKLQEIKGRGTTIVIVSHAMSQLELICDRSIWVADGLVKMEGKPRDVHPRYMEWMSRKTQQEEKKEDERENKEDTETDNEGNLKRWGSGEARMTGVKVLGADGTEKTDFSPWDPFTIHIDYTAKKPLGDAVIGLAVYRSDGMLVYGTNTLIDTSSPVTLKTSGTIDLRIDGLPASNGSYSIDLAIHRPDGFNYDFWRDICTIRIADKVQTPGEIALSHQWDIH
ncbi:ABC transporter ATP-binding protein [Clostridiales bacterium FE2011]|nr:ABC transporter ATP-binding protein [Clostridiales bacterium FE2011]